MRSLSLPLLLVVMDVLGQMGHVLGQMGYALGKWDKCAAGWGVAARKARGRTLDKTLGCGIISRDFSTYNPKDLAVCKFEAKGSDFLGMMVAHGVGLPFLGCPLLLLHTADTD